MYFSKVSVVFLFSLSVLAAAEDPTPDSRGKRLHFWHNVFGNTYDSFAGWNSLWHLGAVGSTFALAHGGGDNSVQKVFWKDPIGRDFGRVGLFLGWFWQITPAVGMYLWGLKSSHNELIGAGSATIQAIAMTGLVTTVLKFVSGRQAPLKDGDPRAESAFTRTDDATDFRLFNTNFSRSEGRFFWPSGHTSSTITFVSALYAYYPDKHWIAWLGYPLSLGMGLSVLENDSHWLSDVVAGAMIGHIIGWTTGKNFRRDFSGEGKTAAGAPAAGQKIRYAQPAFIPRREGTYLALVFEF
jgi:membrane-associated phospholipid phosphatase